MTSCRSFYSTTGGHFFIVCLTGYSPKTGIHFIDYVNRLRIEKAKNLLYSTTLSIKEIGFQVGFSDEKYFMKVFKKLEGLSPSQYRHAFYLLHQNQH